MRSYLSCKHCGLTHDNPKEACSVHECEACGNEIWNSDALYCNTCLSAITDTLNMNHDGIPQIYRLYIDGGEKTQKAINNVFLFLFGKTFQRTLIENTRNVKVKKFAETFWQVGDVAHIAEFEEVKLTTEEMATWLDEMQEKLNSAMLDAGWYVLEQEFRTKWGTRE